MFGAGAYRHHSDPRRTISELNGSGISTSHVFSTYRWNILRIMTPNFSGVFKATPETWNSHFFKLRCAGKDEEYIVLDSHVSERCARARSKTGESCAEPRRTAAALDQPDSMCARVDWHLTCGRRTFPIFAFQSLPCRQIQAAWDTHHALVHHDCIC